MPISHTRKFIFFHIPRCAGTSLETHFNLTRKQNCHGVIRRDGKILTLHHLTPHDMLNMDYVTEETFKVYFKFTILRDPFDRLVSDYLWQQDHDRHNEFHGISFQQFLDKAQNVIRDQRYLEKLHYDHFRPMIEYCFTDGELMLDDILVLENIEHDLARIENSIGMIRLPHLNSSNHRQHSLDNGDNRDRVYEIYAHDKMLYDGIINTRDGAD